MHARVVQVGPSSTDVLLRSPVPWPLVLVAAVLGTLHLGVALFHLQPGSRAAMIAGAVGLAFLLTAIAFGCLHRDLEISVSRRYIRARRGFGRFSRERAIPFSAVQSVRLTQVDHHGHHQSRIDLLCDRGDVPCPTTDMPRQQALLLAMALNVQLIKVWQSSSPTRPEHRLHELFPAD